MQLAGSVIYNKIKHTLVLLCLILGIYPVWSYAQSQSVPLRWLSGKAPAVTHGLSWGVPWHRGEIPVGQSFSLVSSTGDTLPLQHWPLAYWPDGSIKWMGYATVSNSSYDSLRLIPVSPQNQKSRLQTQVRDKGIYINTGKMECLIPKSGSHIVESLKVGDKIVAKDGRLVAIREDRSRYEKEGILKEEPFESQIITVVLEQAGPVRTVVKIKGVHHAVHGDRSWLPFIVRLYFYAGQQSMHIVHTFIYDGDQQKDFIKGLGIQFTVPLEARKYNRQIRFAGDTGLFAEPVRLIAGRTPPDKVMYRRQIAGKPMPKKNSIPGHDQLDKIVGWNDYKLNQLDDASYRIEKRTSEESAWIKSSEGAHSGGLVYIGSPDGGLAMDMQNFWQLSPIQLEIQGAATAMAKVTIWMWSPDAPAMDLRHYDTKGHGLKASYEDYEKGYSTATGIARTSELTVRAFTSVPDDKTFMKIVQDDENPPLLVCPPQYYHSVKTFGYWSLPDRSIPLKETLENQLDLMFKFYSGQVKQRHWYGFWDYGDIMHTYDPYRHQWKYDVGGYAWMNTEECPEVWLWYSFLRTGRSDIFRMAEAMSRHTGEVDVYHMGKFKGLGSRHNVRHWGGGAKELRISQAFYKRFYYYLTTDERTGDLMHAEANADYALLNVDPLRKILPESSYPTHIRSGPDWLATVGNWMTEWERTGNEKYRDKIITGMKSLVNMPEGLLTSLSFGYDPKTGKLYNIPDQQMPVGQFVMIMSGAEVSFELQTLLDVPGWSDTWLRLCKYWADNGGGDMAGPRAVAYAAYKTGDARLGHLAWKRMFEKGDGMGLKRFPQTLDEIDGPQVPYPIEEVPRYVATGHLCQWALNIIETLELAGKWSPSLKDVEQ